MISGMRIIMNFRSVYDYKMWQYSEAGTVPGIRASVDLDLWFQEEN